MAKSKASKVIKCIIIGVISFFLLLKVGYKAAGLFVDFQKKSKYKYIYEITDHYTDLEINNIYDNGETGIEIYLGEIKDIDNGIMLDLYSFAKELDKYLNEHKEIFSSDKNIRPIRITATGKVNRESHLTIISNYFSDKKDIGSEKTEYSFDTYYCYFPSDFMEINYLSDAENLLFFYDVSDISGADSFKNLRYLYIKTEDSKKEELKELLPECNIEFENDNTQRQIFY